MKRGTRDPIWGRKVEVVNSPFNAVNEDQP